MQKPKEELVFANGLISKRRDTAPDYVLVNQSIQVDDFITFLKKHDKNGWVNLETRKSANGNIYTIVDSWQPKAKETGHAQEHDI